MDVAGVKAALNERAEAVCQHLYPQGKRDGVNWCVGDVEFSEAADVRPKYWRPLEE